MFIKKVVFSSGFFKTFLSIISLLLLISVFYIINKGIDITDEGFCLMLYDPSQEFMILPLPYVLYMQTLTDFFTLTIVDYRYIRLLLVFSSFIFCFFGFIKYIEKTYNNFLSKY